MLHKTIRCASMLAALASFAHAGDRTFFALYPLQYSSTSLVSNQDGNKTGSFNSSWVGLMGGGVADGWLAETDMSGLVAALMDPDKSDGGIMSVRLGHNIISGDVSVGAAAVLDFHSMNRIKMDGWSGLGGLVYSKFNVGNLHFLPKVAYVVAGTESDHNANIYNIISMECGVGMQLGGGFAITAQPSYDIRSLPEKGSANRFMVRLGVAAVQ